MSPREEGVLSAIGTKILRFKEVAEQEALSRNQLYSCLMSLKAQKLVRSKPYLTRLHKYQLTLKGLQAVQKIEVKNKAKVFAKLDYVNHFVERKV